MKKPFLGFLLLIAVMASPSSYERVLVLGDSLTVGAYASSQTKTFRFLLAEALDADLAGSGYYNLPTLQENWRQYMKWQPDLIVVEIGINDVIRYGPNVDKLNDETWPVAYAEMLREMKATGATVVATTLYFAPHQPDRERWEQYNQFIREAAQQEGVLLADVWAATVTCRECVSRPGELSAFPSRFEGDYFHPGDVGHQVIAQTILDVLPTWRTYLPSVFTSPLGGMIQ